LFDKRRRIYLSAEPVKAANKKQAADRLQYGKSVRDRYQPLSTKLPCGGSPWGIAWWGKAASRLVKPVKSSYFRPIIEEPRSKLRGIFDRKELGLFFVSLANPAASGGECTRCCGSSHPLCGLSLARVPFMPVNFGRAIHQKPVSGEMGVYI
jgi:hypothetical protein